MVTASFTVSVRGSTPSSSAARRIAERMRSVSACCVSASRNSATYHWPVTPMERANTSLSGEDRRSNRDQRSPNSSFSGVSSSCSRRRSNSASRSWPSGDSMLLSAVCMSASLSTASLESRAGARKPRPVQRHLLLRHLEGNLKDLIRDTERLIVALEHHDSLPQGRASSQRWLKLARPKDEPCQMAL